MEGLCELWEQAVSLGTVPVLWLEKGPKLRPNIGRNALHFFWGPKIGLTLTMGGLFFSGHCRHSGSIFGSENLSFWTSGGHFGTLGSILGGPVWPGVARSGKRCQNVVRGPSPGPPQGTQNPSKRRKLEVNFSIFFSPTFRWQRDPKTWDSGPSDDLKT